METLSNFGTAQKKGGTSKYTVPRTRMQPYLSSPPREPQSDINKNGFKRQE